MARPARILLQSVGILSVISVDTGADSIFANMHPALLHGKGEIFAWYNAHMSCDWSILIHANDACMWSDIILLLIYIHTVSTSLFFLALISSNGICSRNLLPPKCPVQYCLSQHMPACLLLWHPTTTSWVGRSVFFLQSWSLGLCYLHSCQDSVLYDQTIWAYTPSFFSFGVLFWVCL